MFSQDTQFSRLILRHTSFSLAAIGISDPLFYITQCSVMRNQSKQESVFKKQQVVASTQRSVYIGTFVVLKINMSNMCSVERPNIQ